MSRLAMARVPIALVGFATLVLAGCGKAKPPGIDASGGRGSAEARPSGDKGVVAALLTKEEVGAVLGQPVTSIEGKGTHLTYKTDEVLLEANIEVDQKRNVADAVQAMQGARKATGFLGGKPEDLPGLGDEAFFGAMSFLYFRKGNAVITITPPNLQQMAGLKAYNKVTEAKGQEETIKAMEELKKVESTDPAAAGLAGGDAMQGALATIKSSSKKKGTQYEADSRAMALALANKLVERL